MDDCAVLAQLGVDCQQGYLFSAPTTRPYWAIKPENRKTG